MNATNLAPKEGMALTAFAVTPIRPRVVSFMYAKASTPSLSNSARKHFSLCATISLTSRVPSGPLAAPLWSKWWSGYP